MPAFELNVEFHISHIVWVKIFQHKKASLLAFEFLG